MSFRIFWSKYGRGILIGVSTVTAVAAPVATAFIVPKVEKKIKKLRSENGTVTKSEMIRAAFPEVILPVVMTAISAGTGLAAHSMANNAITVSNAIVSATQAGRKATDEVLKEALPEKKYEEISKKITEKTIEATPQVFKPKTARTDIVIDTGHGTDEFIDVWSRQKFNSSWNFILSKANEWNAQINDGYDVTVNDWLLSIGLDAVDAGDAFFFPEGIKFSMGSPDEPFWRMNDEGRPQGQLVYAEGFEPHPVTRPLARI